MKENQKETNNAIILLRGDDINTHFAIAQEAVNMIIKRRWNIIIVEKLIVTALLTQVSWTNHLAIMLRAKTVEESHFYITLCIKESYSSRELERQMESAYYERYMLSKEKVLPEPIKGLKENPFMDTYVVEFLDMAKNL